MKMLKLEKTGTRGVNSIEMKFTNRGKGKERATYIEMTIHFDDGKDGVFETEAEHEMVVAIKQLSVLSQ